MLLLFAHGATPLPTTPSGGCFLLDIVILFPCPPFIAQGATPVTASGGFDPPFMAQGATPVTVNGGFLLPGEALIRFPGGGMEAFIPLLEAFFVGGAQLPMADFIV